jgi:hypothetical protein
MYKLTGGRPGFREWVDGQRDPKWGLLPLTHITSAVVGEDIIRDGKVTTKTDSAFGVPLAYYFYGRPAFRLSKEKVIKFELCVHFVFFLIRV